MNFNVKNRRTQSSFETSDGEDVLNAAVNAGLGLPHSCRAGNCGSCKALLLKGDIKHEDFDESALKDRDRQQGFILLCRSKARSDLEIDVEEYSELLSPGSYWPARIDVLKPLCHDVMLMRVRLAPGKKFSYVPGQYMDFVLADSRRRSFSIAGFDGNLIDFHVRNVAGGMFSEQVFNHYRQGQIVRLYGPMGTFFIRQTNTQPIIMLAGGTGIAPIKSMLEDLSLRGSAPPTQLYWGVQTLEDIYLKYWLEAFARQNDWFEFTTVLSEADEFYPSRKGFVHLAVLEDHNNLSAYQVYASGPPAMIKAAQLEFTPGDAACSTCALGAPSSS